MFCTEGQKNPDKCWMPLPPYTTGAYMTMPYCQRVDPYGKPWTPQDYDSLGQYQRVCPIAMKSGGWTKACQYVANGALSTVGVACFHVRAVVFISEHRIPWRSFSATDC